MKVWRAGYGMWICDEPFSRTLSSCKKVSFSAVPGYPQAKEGPNLPEFCDSLLVWGNILFVCQGILENTKPPNKTHLLSIKPRFQYLQLPSHFYHMYCTLITCAFGSALTTTTGIEHVMLAGNGRERNMKGSNILVT